MNIAILRNSIVIFCLFCLFTSGHTQVVNWNALEGKQHLVKAGIGWDYSVSYDLGYGIYLPGKFPALLNIQFSVPSGKQLLDDFKVGIGGQLLVLNQKNIKASVGIHGIYRRFENPLVRLQNFGCDMKGVIGYYQARWFVAGEVAFDKAIVTHFKHSSIYRENIFPDARDGWYDPTTGGHFRFGIQTGYTMKRSDITFGIGGVLNEDFKTSPLIPYYVNLGYTFRFLTGS